MPPDGLDLAGVGRRVRARREALGLSLDDLSRLCGVSRSMLSEVERVGRTPTVLVLDRIATGLGRTTIAAGVDAGTFPAHAQGSREYLAVERGRLALTLDGQQIDLSAGDSVYYAGDCRHGYRNPGRRPCVYYLAMDVPGQFAHASEAPP